MALDTYSDVWGRVLLRCPALGPLLAKDLVRNAFRQVAEKRRWSWLVKQGQFVLPAQYTTGTVTVTRNSYTVTGALTVWTGDMVGRQFRLGVTTPIYTIEAVNSATSIELDLPWGGATASSQAYSIYQAYATPPDDFHALVSVWDPTYNWQLWTNIQQTEINRWDAQRSNSSQSYCVSCRDYSTSHAGTTGTPLQVYGTGNDPSSSGTYTGAADAIFTVECTLGGASGVATFRWKKDSGSYTAGVVTDVNAQALQDGVNVYWPAGVNYTLGDIWVISCKASSAPGLPRYELWPHQRAEYTYPFLYESRAVDLSDSGAVLPRYIRGDVLVELALADAAKWPGTTEQKNPYYDLALARTHFQTAERMVAELERQDEETSMQGLIYTLENMPMAPLPFGDSNWLQSHAI